MDHTPKSSGSKRRGKKKPSKDHLPPEARPQMCTSTENGVGASQILEVTNDLPKNELKKDTESLNTKPTETISTDDKDQSINNDIANESQGCALFSNSIAVEKAADVCTMQNENKDSFSEKTHDNDGKAEGTKVPNTKAETGISIQNPGCPEKTGIATKGGAGGVQKSKGELRKERNAIQEAQRAAKLARKSEAAPNAAVAKGPQQQQQKVQQQQQQKPQQQKSTQRVSESDSSSQPKKVQNQAQMPKKTDQTSGPHVVARDAKLRVPNSMQLDDEKVVSRITKKMEKKHIPMRNLQQKKVSLFKHLHQYEHDNSLTSTVLINSGNIHPAILKLGLQYASGIITGSKARCVALLKVLKEVIDDYQTPDNKDLARDLDVHLSPFISFLNQCRQQSVSMGNAIKYIKHHINNTPSDCPDKQAKENLKTVINQFYRERILLAAKAISEFAYGIIEDEDLILVYACSSVVRKVLVEAHSKGKKFKVIVVDGRPKFEGVAMVSYLRGHGIKCSYIHINTISHVMAKVTKVLLGAHAILANGYVMSRIGSAQVCLIAHVFNVMVFVCCESYKFCDRVQPDSFVFNELGDPDEIARVSGHTNELAEWRSTPTLYLLNLVYDVTPHELVTLVITDVGVIQPTSVPMVLRVKNPEAYY